jgi:hypothetical protein
MRESSAAALANAGQFPGQPAFCYVLIAQLFGAVQIMQNAVGVESTPGEEILDPALSAAWEYTIEHQLPTVERLPLAPETRATARAWYRRELGLISPEAAWKAFFFGFAMPWGPGIDRNVPLRCCREWCQA